MMTNKGLLLASLGMFSMFSNPMVPVLHEDNSLGYSYGKRKPQLSEKQIRARKKNKLSKVSRKRNRR